MSQQLRILPEEFPNSDASYNLILFNVEDENFEQLNELDETIGIEVSNNGITCYCVTNDEGDVFYGNTSLDAFGDTIKSVTVEQFLNALKYYKPDNYTNRAVIAYLKELLKELRLFLYWH